MPARPLGRIHKAVCHITSLKGRVRISVETRGSPVDLVYAALDVGGEIPRRCSSSSNNFGKSL